MIGCGSWLQTWCEGLRTPSTELEGMWGGGVGCGAAGLGVAQGVSTGVQNHGLAQGVSTSERYHDSAPRTAAVQRSPPLLSLLITSCTCGVIKHHQGPNQSWRRWTTLARQLQEPSLGVSLVSGFSSSSVHLAFRLNVLETYPICLVWDCSQINALQHTSCTGNSMFCQKPPEKTLRQTFLSRLKFMAIMV